MILHVYEMMCKRTAQFYVYVSYVHDIHCILFMSRGGGHPENVYPCQDGTAKPLPSLAQNLRKPCIWPSGAPGQVRRLWLPGFQLPTHLACTDIYLIQPIYRHVRPVKLTWPGVTYLACNSGHMRRLIWPQGLIWLVTNPTLCGTEIGPRHPSIRVLPSIGVPPPQPRVKGTLV